MNLYGKIMSAIEFSKATQEQQAAEIEIIRGLIAKLNSENQTAEKHGHFAFLTKMGNIQLYKGDVKSVEIGMYIEVSGKWTQVKLSRLDGESGRHMLLGSIECGRALLLTGTDNIQEEVAQYYELPPNVNEFVNSAPEQQLACIELIKLKVIRLMSELNNPSKFRMFLTESGKLERRGGKTYADYVIGDDIRIDQENSVCVFAGSMDIDITELNEVISNLYIPKISPKDSNSKTLAVRNDYFVLFCNYNDRHIPKDAGMKYDFNSRYWFTTNPAIANKFIEFADREALKKLNQIISN